MSADALSPRQFYKEQSLTQQGNMDELANQVRGLQNMTSNRFIPSFSSDYTTVHSMPSGTAFKEGRTGAALEENEDEE